uniref:FKIAA0680 n=1 Tax=Takifugu rubripes TaxID=31033 RepID=O42498_TAKRU|nr:fKIAA0680 [Takifugu rubripes]
MVLNLCLPDFNTTVHCNKTAMMSQTLYLLNPLSGGEASKLEYFLRPPVQFKLVGRCELREDNRVSFSNLSYGPRPPFPSLPPLHPAGCRQEGLWSRGPLSLGAVTQLRVTIAFGGAASALGFKALAVWGTASTLLSCRRTWRELRPSIRPVEESTTSWTFWPITPTPSRIDFLDPITQEVMVLPMLLPSGMSVDTSTLEEHQKREATWGRAPTDPFTVVPFTSVSRPVPNPQLKSRIGHFLLRNGLTGLNGSCRSSHEERLSASLDDALVSVLRGRPSFTSNLSLQRRVAPDSADSEPAQDTHSCQATSAGPAGGTMCSACSCSMSVYSKSTPSVYRLACGHLLCRSCLHSESQQVDAAGLSNHVRCPACRSATPRCDVVRVHR